MNLECILFLCIILFIDFGEGVPTNIGVLKHHVFIYQIIDAYTLEYKAFCSGNIITNTRVLSSAHCFITNGKRQKLNFTTVRVVGGVLTTVVKGKIYEKERQFRAIVKLYSQYAFNYPIYNLAVLEMNKPWTFNDVVNQINMAELDMDIEGVCHIANARVVESWAFKKHLSIEEVVVYNKEKCENILLASPVTYLCCDCAHTKIPIARESEGAGLICHGTNDPQDFNNTGVLVGVLTVINKGLPLIYHRVGIFRKWIMDRAEPVIGSLTLITLSFVFHLI